VAAAKRLLCVPVELHPHQRLGLTRCEVIAGVTLSKLSHGLRSTLDRLIQQNTGTATCGVPSRQGSVQHP